jgi:hypothetical protein
MRLKAIPPLDSSYRRLILYATATQGVYLFLSVSGVDGTDGYDEWYLTVEEAQAAAERYGVDEADWTPIPGPLPGTQHDTEAPLVVVRDAQGRIIRPPQLITYAEAQRRGLVPPAQEGEDDTTR